MKFIKCFLILFSILALQSCKKSFFDINNNPNQTTSAAYQIVLPSSMNSIARVVSTNAEFSNLWMGFWAISGSYATDKSRDSYDFSNTYYQNIWSTFYSILSNLNYVESNAKVSKDVFYQGIAKTLKVLCFHNLVDIYGDIPYKQALQIEKYPNPKYDSDTAIYRDLFVQLDSARYLISKWDGDFLPAPDANSDLIFKGDTTLWFKFINTLELRLLLRFSEVNKPSYFTKELNIVNGDSHGFLSSGESVAINPGYSNGSDDNLNPFYFDYGFNYLGARVSNYAFYVANKYAVDFFNTTSDPRIRYFYAPYSGKSYGGNEFGYQGSTSNISRLGASESLLKTGTSNIGIINSPSQDAIILSSTESLFLQAEASQRKLILDKNYSNFYKQALQESFYADGVDSTTVFDYYSQTDPNVVDLVNVDLSANPLSTIMTQKWASVNVLNPLEVYADYRRTKVPNVPGSKFSKTDNQIPLRLYYPNTERQTNAANVPSQPSKASLYTKIFWIP